MKYKRRNEKYRDAKARTKDWNEMTSRLTKEELKYETARCMDCGVPFCTSDTGCPISNVILNGMNWFSMIDGMMPYKD